MVSALSKRPLLLLQRYISTNGTRTAPERAYVVDVLRGSISCLVKIVGVTVLAGWGRLLKAIQSNCRSGTSVSREQKQSSRSGWIPKACFRALTKLCRLPRCAQFRVSLAHGTPSIISCWTCVMGDEAGI